MKKAGTIRVVAIVRRRGRPRLASPSYRLETMIPREVLDQLKQVEAESGVYRTRIACKVLCEWAHTKAPDAVTCSHPSAHQ